MIVRPARLLSLLCLACSPVTLAVGAENDSTDPDTVQLGTLVVTGTRTEKSLDDTPVRTQVVSAEEIRRTHARTLKEALENVPGLQLVEIHGKSGYEVQMQGLNSDEVLVLIDGFPVAASTGSTVDLSQFALVDVERIEIVKGATSAQFGSSAMGGVINVITRRVEPGLSAVLVADAGSYGDQNTSGKSLDAARQHLRGNLEGGNRSLRGRLSAEWLQDDGFTTDTSSWDREGDTMRRRQFDARGDWRPDPASLLWLEGNRYDEDTSERYSYYAPPNTIPQMLSETVSRNRLGAGASRTWSNGLRSELRALDEHYDGLSLEYSQGYETARRDTGQHLDHVSAQVDLPVWYAQVWTLGSDYHRSTLVQTVDGVSEIDGGRAVSSSRELFVQNDITLGSRVELLPGLRYQDDSDFGGHSAPKLSLRWTWLDSLDWRSHLRLSYGAGYRVPNLKERHYLFDHSSLGYKVVGNPDLKPESSRSWQAGISLLSGDERFSADLNLFRNHVEDLIQTDLDNAQVINGIAYYSYENVARARTRGAELGVQWQLIRVLRLTGSWTWTDTKDLDTGLQLTRRPRVIARLGADWTVLSGTGLSLRLRHQGHEFGDSANQERSPAWNSLDLKLNQQLSDAMSLFAGIDNLTNEQRDFNATTDYRPISGRNFYLGLRYAWDHS